MNIKIGKYVITSDDLQFIVSQIHKSRKGVNKGKENEINVTYHSTLQSCMENILKRKVLASKVSSIQELLTVIKEQTKEIQKIFKMTLETKSSKKTKKVTKKVKI